ncbi:hypothetical protein DFH11DRAFT_1571382 [Phellopilus nigrolimitatus]|nr:hypothetical protein DFH11DRAFT_1571382 [Phellopilus nigrolimitatus]
MVYTCTLLVVPFVAFVTLTIAIMVIGSPLAFIDGTGQSTPRSNLSIPGAFYCVIMTNANFTAGLTSGFWLTSPKSRHRTTNI